MSISPEIIRIRIGRMIPRLLKERIIKKIKEVRAFKKLPVNRHILKGRSGNRIIALFLMDSLPDVCASIMGNSMILSDVLILNMASRCRQLPF
jgi:hypothetical protein